VMRYRPVGLFLGLTIALLGNILFVLVVVMDKRWRSGCCGDSQK